MTIEIRPEKSQLSPTSPRQSQYSLRSLFVVVTGLCVLLAVYSYTGEPWFLTAFAIGTPVACFLLAMVVLRGVQREWAVVAAICSLFAMLMFPPYPSRSYSYTRIDQCSYHLRTISVALQNYESTYGTLPPAYIADENGKPLHSWRVLILPFLELGSVYAQYRFDEPWDGPNNRQLEQLGNRFFQCPEDSKRGTTCDTNFVTVIGPQAAWPGATPLQQGELRDKPGRTILLVEVRNSGIHWMEPRDLDLAQMPYKINAPVPGGPGSHHRGCCHAVCCDGSVVRLQNELPAVGLRALLTKAGHEDTTLWEKWIR